MVWLGLGCRLAVHDGCDIAFDSVDTADVDGARGAGLVLPPLRNSNNANNSNAAAGPVFAPAIVTAPVPGGGTAASFLAGVASAGLAPSLGQLYDSLARYAAALGMPDAAAVSLPSTAPSAAAASKDSKKKSVSPASAPASAAAASSSSAPLSVLEEGDETAEVDGGGGIGSPGSHKGGGGVWATVARLDESLRSVVSLTGTNTTTGDVAADAPVPATPAANDGTNVSSSVATTSGGAAVAAVALTAEALAGILDDPDFGGVDLGVCRLCCFLQCRKRYV
jgi:hypothetical protein